jgi:hypothetical protein
MATEKVIPMTEKGDRNVHANDDGQVDNETVHISKGAGEQVTWFSRKKAIVVFASQDGSPFEETTFHVPAGGSVSSGPATPAAEHDKSYKYTVVGEKGVNDPDELQRSPGARGEV